MDDEEELKKDLGHLIIVHYSTTGRDATATVTGIIAKEYVTEETSSFTFEKYDSEREMLDAFARFVGGKESCVIGGWSIRGDVYGIEHLRKRLKEKWP